MSRSSRKLDPRRHIAADGSRALRLVSGWRPEALVLAVALLVRWLYLLEARCGPAFYEPIIDPGTYDLLARRILAGDGLDRSAFVQGIFYPLWLALAYAITGGSIFAAKALQTILGALTACLAARLGRRCYGPGHGLIAGLIVALYGPLVFHDAELMATGWAALWTVTLILLLVRISERPPSLRRDGYCLALGLVAALSILTRATFIPFLLAAGAWLGWRLTREAGAPPRGHAVGAWASPRTAALRAACFAGATALALLLPAAALNHAHNGDFSVLPSNGPLNLYLGNNPDRCRTLTARPGPDYNRLVEMPLQAGLHSVTQQKRYFNDLVRAYAQNEPLGLLRGLAAKTIEYLTSREIPKTEDVYQYRQWSGTLSMLVWKLGPFGFPFGALLPVAAIGLVLRRRQTPAPVYLFLLLYSAAVIAVHVCGRYRAPIVPVLAVPAAAGLVAFFQAVGRRERRAIGWSATTVAVTLAVSTLPGPFCLETVDYDWEMPRLIGQRHFLAGRYAAAETSFRQALQRRPGDAETLIDLGEALVQQGRAQDGIAIYRSAIQQRSDLPEAHHRLGIALLSLQRFAEAADAERRAVQLAPDLAEAHSNLGTALAYLGRMEESVGAFRSAVQLQPERAAFRFNLGSTLLMLGRSAEALPELQQATQREPDAVAWRAQLGIAYEQLGRRAEAEAAYRSVLQAMPNDPVARQGLARVQGSDASPPRK
jgi:Flp pilus assembly protein TadD